MARHARTSAIATAVGGFGNRVRAWAARTERGWLSRFPSGRSKGHLGAGVAKEASMLLGLFAATVGIFGLLFVMAGHPLRPRAQQQTPSSRAAAATTSGQAATEGPATTSATAGPSTTVSTTIVPVTPPAAPTTQVAVEANGVSAAPAAADLAGPIDHGQAPPSNPPGSPSGPPPSLDPPVSGGVLQGFGWAYSDVFGDWQQHTGIDLRAQAGENILSPGAGVVSSIRQDALWGTVVSIAMDHGYSTNVSPFAHVNVQVGQAVQAGTPLGTATGASSAEITLPAHVFWQVFANTRPIDPAVG